MPLDFLLEQLNRYPENESRGGLAAAVIGAQAEQAALEDLKHVAEIKGPGSVIGKMAEEVALGLEKNAHGAVAGLLIAMRSKPLQTPTFLGLLRRRTIVCRSTRLRMQSMHGPRT